MLEVGCGDGFYLGLLREFGKKSWTLKGIDLNKRAIEMANCSGLDVHFGSVEQVELPNESYDMIFMIKTMQQVEKPDEVLRAIYKLLRKGGRLVIVTNNTNSIDFR